MSRLSTSNSKPTGWNRVWREVLRVFLLLLALEMLVRVGPIHAFLSQRLDPYENLLWYDHRLPSYQNQLRADPNYVIWMLGSSPMMTAWTPVQIQESLREAVHADVTRSEERRIGKECRTSLTLLVCVYTALTNLW